MKQFGYGRNYDYLMKGKVDMTPKKKIKKTKSGAAAKTNTVEQDIVAPEPTVPPTQPKKKRRR